MTNQEEWEKRFLENFNHGLLDGRTHPQTEHIISFIRTELARQREEFDKTLNSGRKMYELGRQEEREANIMALTGWLLEQPEHRANYDLNRMDAEKILHPKESNTEPKVEIESEE